MKKRSQFNHMILLIHAYMNKQIYGMHALNTLSKNNNSNCEKEREIERKERKNFCCAPIGISFIFTYSKSESLFEEKRGRGHL